MKGVSNLMIDLIVSLVVIGFFTAVLASTTHLTNNVRTYMSQARENPGYMGRCVLGWLITNNESRGKLVIGNPFNRSVTVAVLVNGLKTYEVHVGAHGISEVTITLRGNVSDLKIVGPNNCVSRVQEVILP